MVNDMDLTLQGDDIEPLVCSVCGSTDAGAGELNKGVFTCWECIKKREKPKRGNPHDQHGSANPNFRHGMSGSSTYATWENMIARCTKDKCKNYKDYGARGITVCDRWKSFRHFYEDMGVKPDGLTLERIDNDKGYYKENCRWASRKEQQNNLRRTIYVVFKCEVVSLGYLATELGINLGTLNTRVKAGWPEELWGETPNKGKRRMKRAKNRQEGDY